MRLPKASSRSNFALPNCWVVRGQDKGGGAFWRGYVVSRGRQLASRNFFDSTYGGESEASVAAQAWFEAVSALVREVFSVAMTPDDEAQLTPFKAGLAVINARCDVERPRWAFLSIYVVYWNKQDPDAQQLRFLVSDRGQTLQRREGAVNVGGRAGRSWPEALTQLQAKVHAVLTEFFGTGPADTFMARHRALLSPDQFDPAVGLKVWERLDQLVG